MGNMRYPQPMSSTQKAPLPGATIPWGATGPWTPPTQFGVLKSPAINPTAANWPAQPAPPSVVYPQFCTDLGQQIGNKFFFYGTYGTVNGQSGYLQNPYDQQNRYGAPAGAPMIMLAQVTAPDNWQEEQTVFTPGQPPPGTTGKTNAQLVAEIAALLGQIK